MASTTRLKRVLGKLLADLREHAGLTIAHVARSLGVEVSTVSRYESGENRIQMRVGLEHLLDLYKATAEQRALAHELWALTAKRAKLPSLPEGTSLAFRELVSSEGDAHLVQHLAPSVFPARLQTDAYSLALHRVGKRSDEAIERAVALRRTRQEQLSGTRPLHLAAVITEGVIRRVVGTPAEMADQLDRVIEMSEWPNVKINVLAERAGPFQGMMSTLSIYHFHYPPGSRVAYIEHDGGSDLVENEADVQHYSAWFDDALRMSLSASKSVKLIKDRARELRG
ncbi:helix-turn-helix domain-containing protein [Crossiella sp. NPDC003009]